MAGVNVLEVNVNFVMTDDTSYAQASVIVGATGAGAGIDFVTVYDTVLRFEYTFTREGTRGFFFNIKKEF